MARFELRAKLGLDGQGFFNTINAAKSAGANLGSALKNQLGAVFSTAAILAASKAVIKYGSDVADLSKKVGISTTALQEIGYAAKLSGSTLEEVAAGFRGLAKARDAALAGDEGKMGTFAAFGVDQAMLKAGNLEQIFKRIAATVQTTDFGADQLPMIEDVFGRTGAVLIPLMVNGLEPAVEEARNLGVVMDEDVIQNLDKAGDAIDRLTARIRGPLGSAVAFLADQLRTTWDFLDIGIGGAGAFLGGLMGTEGGSAEKYAAAVKAFQEHRDKILDDRIAAETPPPPPEREKGFRPETYSKEELKLLEAAKMPLATKAKKEQDLASVGAPTQLNELQRIGGFSAGSQRDDSQDQIKTLQDIHTAVRDVQTAVKELKLDI